MLYIGREEVVISVYTVSESDLLTNTHKLTLSGKEIGKEEIEMSFSFVGWIGLISIARDLSLPLKILRKIYCRNMYIKYHSNPTDETSVLHFQYVIYKSVCTTVCIVQEEDY